MWSCTGGCPVRIRNKEGFSIPAQLRLLHEYAASRGFVVVGEFVDIETAKASGRTRFGEMLAYLKKHHASCRTILVEKTDRLYRNPKDWVTLDELDVEIHFVKENQIVSKNSRSSEKLIHGIKVLFAKNTIDKLSEETRKGMPKARSGIYPSYAPVGYRNVDGPNGKRVIHPDPETAPVITEIYERFATGKHSLESLMAELGVEGVTLRGRRIYRSMTHQILRKRLYMGDFDWDGVTYQGTHEPLGNTGVLGPGVQEALDTREANRTRKVKTTSLTPAWCTVGIVDAFMLENSRSIGTCTITARAIEGNAPNRIRARKSSLASSLASSKKS
jgi:site-specific DNA recombinase